MQCASLTLHNKRCKIISKNHMCHIHSKKHDNCSICMKNMIRPHMLHCGHCFHKNCIKKWENTQIKNSLHFNCPICRERIYFYFSNCFQKLLIPFSNSDQLDLILDIAIMNRFSHISFTRKLDEIFS